MLPLILVFIGFLFGIFVEKFTVRFDQRALKQRRDEQAKFIMLQVEELRKVIVPFIRANREAQRLIIILFMLKHKIKEFLDG